MAGRRRMGLVVDRCAPLWLGGLAAFGIIAAHCLAYVIAEPHAHERAMLMDATGHRKWAIVAAVAMGAALAGAAYFLVRVLRPARSGKRVDLFGFAVPRLMGLQLGGFVLLEVSERALMGDGWVSIMAEPAVVAGFFLQIVVALGSAILLCFLTRTLRALLAGDGAPTETETGIVLRPVQRLLQMSLSLGTGAGSWRGPPVRT